MAHTNDYYEYPHAGWWQTIELIAKKMQVSELRYAIDDCYRAGKAMPINEGKYYDEASIYYAQLRKRQRKEKKDLSSAKFY